jgi:hypothetical protein
MLQPKTIKMNNKNTTTIDLLTRTKIFLDLASCSYDITDRHRFSKINNLIDLLLSPHYHHHYHDLLHSIEGVNPHWTKRILNDLDLYYKNHLSTLNKTAQKKEIQWAKDSVKLYYKIDEILNRVDVIQIAFLLRDSEYDIYTNRITQDLNNPMFNTVKKLKKYIIKNIANGNCENLDEMGYWGVISNTEYVPTIVLHQRKDSESDENTTSDWIDAPRKRRKKKKFRVEDRIQWGAEKMHPLIEKYKRNYAHRFD